MKIGGGLNYVTGPMGAGKTLYGVRRIAECVLAHQYVVTNVELRPGWEETVARNAQGQLGKLTLGRAQRRKVAARLSEFYVYESDLHEAMRYRLPGSGEARGAFVWDEGHNDLNNRRWKDEGRDSILLWATQLRKLGFVGYLLSQHADNTDAALRRVCNFHVKLQNQREQTRVLGVRATPWPLFLASWYPAHLALAQKVQPVKVERYFLSWHRHLYDTMGLYHGLEGEHDQGVILLGGDPAPVLARKGQADGPGTGLLRPLLSAAFSPLTRKAPATAPPESDEEVRSPAAEHIKA
jgi:Zonular occludens toxin (Zot)